MNTRHCNVCKEEKALEHFHRCKVFPLGRVYTCKPCQKDRARRWYETNKEKTNHQTAAWRSANKGRVLAYKRKWHEKNMRAVQLKSQAWMKANPAMQAYYVAHRRAVKHQATPAWANKFFI